MRRLVIIALVGVLLVCVPVLSEAQVKYQLPDVRNLKHLTSKTTDRAPDIAGNETTVDYYSAPNGQIISTYSYRGRCYAFSTHSNNDVQNTYRIFVDQKGDGLFLEINRSAPWQIPPWIR